MQTLLEHIAQRRRQIVVHSVIYYRLNQNIIDDSTFDRWSRELVELQQKYPEVAEQAPFHDEFNGWDGSTGFHFSGIPWGLNKAQQLLEQRGR